MEQPFTRTSPRSGCKMPQQHFRVVVLPAPFGPMKPKISPGRMVSVRSSTAVFSPYRLVRCRISSIRISPFGLDAPLFDSQIVSSAEVPVKYFGASRDAKAAPARKAVLLYRPVPLSVHFRTATFLMPYRAKSFSAAGPMRSPLTTMGIAGGQETVGIAQMRPSAVSAGTISCGANTACRTVQTGTASAASSVKTSASGSGRAAHNPAPGFRG